MTYLAVPIQVKQTDQACRDIRQAVEVGAELIELRLDYLAEPTADAVKAVVDRARGTGRPIIVTCRPDWEGGFFAGSHEHRQALLRAGVSAGADYVDIELRALDEGLIDRQVVVGGSDVKVIISNHQFEIPPADLCDRLRQIWRHGPDIAKIAYMAGDNSTDSMAALDMIHSQATAGKEIIAMAMGLGGVVSRLLAKQLGGFVSFASLRADCASAPGQITAEQTTRFYRWSDVDSQTALFGVIGYPVGHSMSPVVHNSSFAAEGCNAVYLPMLVGPSREEFDGFVDGLRDRKWLHASGLSVTIPHKRHALDYVVKCGGYVEPLAESIGAINTLVIGPGENISGHNTDYAGALDAITEELQIDRSDLAGRTAAVLGAGGVARAIVAGLTGAGVKVTVYNRTVERAKVLAEQFGCQFAPLEQVEHLRCEFVINCTNVGMHPEVDASPLPSHCLAADMVVFDTVYNPAETLLLRQARRASAGTVDGVTMFVNQAALQFELFTGRAAPKALMRQVVEEQLCQPGQ